MVATEKMCEDLILKCPNTIIYITNFISEEDESHLMGCIENSPKPKWTQLSNRRLQNYGGVPHVNGMIAEKIPIFLQKPLTAINELGVFGENRIANHILVNEYLPGQGIMPHTDGPLFYPVITTISLGSHTVLTFQKSKQTQDDDIDSLSMEKFSLLVEPRSLLIVTDDLYHNYLHSIDDLIEDCIDDKRLCNMHMCGEAYSNLPNGTIIPRTKRISLTIRHVPKTTKLKLQF